MHEIGDGVEMKVEGPHRGKREHRIAKLPARGRGRLAVEVVDQDQRARRDGEAEHLGCRGQRRKSRREIAESGNDAADYDLEPDDGRHRRIDGLDPSAALLALLGRHQAVHEGEEGEIAAAFREPGQEIVRTEQAGEDRPDREHRECRDQRPARRIAGPAAQLDDRERTVEQRGEHVAPQAEQRRHQRAPSGHRITRAVCSRISRSRKGV